MNSTNEAGLRVEEAPRTGLFRLLGRHQVASIVCTALDFATMHLAVEQLGASPELATLGGATAGAIANFTLGRRWIFDDHRGSVGSQAARYALVSGVSAGLNTLGELGVHRGLGAEYHLARAFVAVLVSLFWNFPMQRRFVFRNGEENLRAKSTARGTRGGALARCLWRASPRGAKER